MIKYTKIGAPIKDVSIPIGISNVVASLATLSTTMRNVAPKSMFTGISLR